MNRMSLFTYLVLLALICQGLTSFHNLGKLKISLVRESNTAFTLSGFDDQERNLTFVKTTFQVLKLKFLVCSMKHAFYSLHKQNNART